MGKYARPRHYCGVPGCGKSFDRPAKLIEHQRTHSGQKPFACSTCHKTFAQKKHLRVHELSHLEDHDRPFKCEVCGKGFVNKQQADRHSRQHEPRQTFRCELCDQVFERRKCYETHVSRHRSCGVCGRICRNEKELQAHVATWHSKRWHCSQCDSKFDSATELRKHAEQEHMPLKDLPPSIAFIVGLKYESRNINCPHNCGHRFTRQYDLERHLKKCHSENFASEESHDLSTVSGKSLETS